MEEVVVLTARVVYIRDTCTHLCNTNPGVKKKKKVMKNKEIKTHGLKTFLL